MYPLHRLAVVTLTARGRPPIAVDAPSVIRLTCLPWDLDLFGEMNNGRVSTLYDLGRFDLAVRTGLSEVLKRRRWGLAVAGSSLRFRRRIRAFDRIEMRTRLVGAEGRWFFIAQSMWSGGEPRNAILLRTAVTSAGGAVMAADVAEAMGRPLPEAPLPDWADAWIGADDQRPWPPVEG